MTEPPQKPERLIPALMAGAGLVLVLGGIALWQRHGLALWLEQAIAFCM